MKYLLLLLLTMFLHSGFAATLRCPTYAAMAQYLTENPHSQTYLDTVDSPPLLWTVLPGQGGDLLSDYDAWTNVNIYKSGYPHLTITMYCFPGDHHDSFYANLSKVISYEEHDKCTYDGRTVPTNDYGKYSYNGATLKCEGSEEL